MAVNYQLYIIKLCVLMKIRFRNVFVTQFVILVYLVRLILVYLVRKTTFYRWIHLNVKQPVQNIDMEIQKTGNVRYVLKNVIIVRIMILSIVLTVMQIEVC